MGINKEKLVSIAKGAAIAAVAAVSTYVLAYLTSAEGQADLGIYGPVVVAALSVGVNALRKFLQSDAPAQQPAQPAAPADHYDI